MIKSIFFPVLANAVSDAGLSVACELAREHDAHVMAMICTSTVEPIAASLSYAPAIAYTTMSEAASGSGSEMSSELTASLAKAGVSHEVHTTDTAWLTISEMAAVHARYCDITVYGRIPDLDARIEEKFFSDLLMQSGRPLLLVPADSTARLSDGAVIAWKPTREATRALHDALPLLAKSKSVQVIAVDPRIDDEEHGGLPGADIGTYLARHGLQVEVLACPRAGKKTGEVILRRAKELGAGLIVAGGYGHRRALEQVFGGVTRTLFDKSNLPVLFSH